MLSTPLPFSNTIRLKISCRSSTPTSVDSTEPTPPESSVPPTTTAAMAESSQPWPAAVSTDPDCEARNTPAQPESAPDRTYTLTITRETDSPISRDASTLPPTASTWRPNGV